VTINEKHEAPSQETNGVHLAKKQKIVPTPAPAPAAGDEDADIAVAVAAEDAACDGTRDLIVIESAAAAAPSRKRVEKHEPVHVNVPISLLNNLMEQNAALMSQSREQINIQSETNKQLIAMMSRFSSMPVMAPQPSAVDVTVVAAAGPTANASKPASRKPAREPDVVTKKDNRVRKPEQCFSDVEGLYKLIADVIGGNMDKQVEAARRVVEAAHAGDDATASAAAEEIAADDQEKMDKRIHSIYKHFNNGIGSRFGHHNGTLLGTNTTAEMFMIYKMLCICLHALQLVNFLVADAEGNYTVENIEGLSKQSRLACVMKLCLQIEKDSDPVVNRFDLLLQNLDTSESKEEIKVLSFGCAWFKYNLLAARRHLLITKKKKPTTTKASEEEDGDADDEAKQEEEQAPQ
jgi:hypothetical protein